MVASLFHDSILSKVWSLRETQAGSLCQLT